VEAVRLVIGSLPASAGVSAIHVGSGERLANLRVARQICELAERPASLITPVNDRPGHDRRYALDCSLLRARGWVPKVGFDEGIARTVRWYAENAATWAMAATVEFEGYLHEQYGERLAPPGANR